MFLPNGLLTLFALYLLYSNRFWYSFVIPLREFRSFVNVYKRSNRLPLNGFSSSDTVFWWNKTLLNVEMDWINHDNILYPIEQFYSPGRATKRRRWIKSKRKNFLILLFSGQNFLTEAINSRNLYRFALNVKVHFSPTVVSSDVHIHKII